MAKATVAKHYGRYLAERLASVHDGEFSVIPFTTALNEGEDQTPYRFIPDSSIELDNRWTCAIQSFLEDEFPAGTDDLVGQWRP
jgi:hypothetical protein